MRLLYTFYTFRLDYYQNNNISGLKISKSVVSVPLGGNQPAYVTFFPAIYVCARRLLLLKAYDYSSNLIIKSIINSSIIIVYVKSFKGHIRFYYVYL